jgi:hypothetical protein
MIMYPHSNVFSRIHISLILALLLGACGGSGSGTDAMDSANLMQQTQPTGTTTLPPPVLSFTYTGLSVTDGITRTGLWRVDAPSLEWEYSLDEGVTWILGVGTTFEVKGDGAKKIWVRSRDSAGNKSVIVKVSCILDTMPPVAVTINSEVQGVTNSLKLFGIEMGARWEYALDSQGPWLQGYGAGLGSLGNALNNIWLRQVDVAGNASEPQILNLNTPSILAHEASGNPLQPSVLALGFQTYLIHGVVVRGDADYVQWEIPKGQRLVSVKLIHYVSEDAISFYALQPNRIFDAGVDTSKMLVYGHMGPIDLSRNVLANIPRSQLGEGFMTLWFQQTGTQNTQYAIEVVLAPMD